MNDELKDHAIIEPVEQVHFTDSMGRVWSFVNKEYYRLWLDGYLAALYTYAWHGKDGLEVGTTGTRYKDVVEAMKKQFFEVTGDQYENTQ